MSRLVEDWNEADAELAAKQSQPRGTLRADMPSAIATQLIIPALPGFYARYPDLQLELGVSDRPSDLVRDRVDCVLRAGKMSDPSLVMRQIGELPFVLCATKDYISRYGFPRHPRDLEKGHSIVRYFFSGTGRRLPLILTKSDDEVTVQGRHLIAVNDANALLASGLAGLGIVRIPALIAQPYIESGALRAILRDWSMETVPVSVIFAPNRHLSTRMRVFVD
jgi:DNA-binding transcriptional LysR family regulator